MYGVRIKLNINPDNGARPQHHACTCAPTQTSPATPSAHTDRNDLSMCLKRFLRFHPGAYYLREGLSRRMVALQAQVGMPWIHSYWAERLVWGSDRLSSC